MLLYAARIAIDDRGRYQRGDPEEHHDLDEPVDQLADELREPDHVDLDLRGLALSSAPAPRSFANSYLARIFSSSTFDRPCVVDPLAGARLLVEQRHEDHARLEIVGDQAADDPRARDVLLQLLDALRRAVVRVRHHRAAAEALLGHFGPSHRRRPQRLDPRAVHAGGEDQLVADLLQGLQVARIEYVAAAVLDHHADRVAQSAQVFLVGEVILDVRLALRDHLLEAGVQREPRCRDVAQQQRDERADDHHRQPMVEHQPLEQVARVAVEVREIADHRHPVEFGRNGGHVSPPCGSARVSARSARKPRRHAVRQARACHRRHRRCP